MLVNLPVYKSSRSRRELVLVIRTLAIVQRGVQRLLVFPFRIEPDFQILLFQRNYAAVVAGSGDFRRRLVGDGGERLQGLAVFSLPFAPQAGDAHFEFRPGVEK